MLVAWRCQPFAVTGDWLHAALYVSGKLSLQHSSVFPGCAGAEDMYKWDLRHGTPGMRLWLSFLISHRRIGRVSFFFPCTHTSPPGSMHLSRIGATGPQRVCIRVP